MWRMKQTLRSDAQPRRRVMHERITEVIRYASTFKRGGKEGRSFKREYLGRRATE